MNIGWSNRRTDLLRGVPLFACCSRRQRRRIASYTTCVHVESGTVLVRDGRPAHQLLVVVSGTAVARHRDGNLEVLGLGACFGETSLSTGQPGTETIVAGSDMVLLAMNRREFHSPYFLIPPVVEALRTSSHEYHGRAGVGPAPVGGPGLPVGVGDADRSAARASGGDRPAARRPTPRPAI